MAKTNFIDGITVVTAAFLQGLLNHVHDGLDADTSAPKVDLKAHVKNKLDGISLEDLAIEDKHVKLSTLSRTKLNFEVKDPVETEHFIFRPGTPPVTAPDPEKNVYDDFTDLYTDLVLAAGARKIVFDNTLTGGVITIPVGSYDFENVSWGVGGVLNVGTFGLLTSGTIQVRLQSGTIIRNLYHVEDLTIINQSTINAPFRYDSGNGEIARFRNSFIESDSTISGVFPLINVRDGTDLEIIAENTRFGEIVGGTTINVASASSLTLSFYTARMVDNTLAGSGTLSAVSMDSNSAGSISALDHPLFTGTLPANITPLSDSQFVIYDPTLASSGLTSTTVQDAIDELAVIATGVTLQEAYDAGNTIVTTVVDGYGGSGPFDVSGEDAISLDSQTASNFTVDGANLSLGTTTSGDVTVSSAAGLDLTASDGLTVSGITHYGTSAGNPTPVTAGFADGDQYYDTGLGMEMRYDGSRVKWLSINEGYFAFAKDTDTAVGVYYAGPDGQLMSATSGFPALYNGTVISLGYTRSDTDSATFEVTGGGTTLDSVASTAVSGVDNTLDGDFTSGSVLAVRNSGTGNTTSNVLGWVRVKWRA
jgi:hypothetical protein